ncbi:uncharacterized protein BDZ99DRAFT_548152 [Mytilinidion resinicola]|uniref:BZIP domain-containing protein n=1 Tax=Mytilinidion resinicola TaxID=574789 RepID=A0A6A6Y3V8_9PEZI|nr:uncharacterized protein BDZ99DRAFT_548152 [Mytilinidion resinicola]KAF2802915.1 hypothetical protein BDZ99DRAFT_548152 [Mytilinidion resinicola]
MVDRRASDAGTASQTPIAPVVKRKRRASCLGEQERRERKRAIDREAQRSLREKTKSHIADLERTIQILRDQDRNGATASLLGEIEQLRQENERLRDVIDGVKSVVGCGMLNSKAVTLPMSPVSASASTTVDPPTKHEASHLDLVEEHDQLEQSTFDSMPFDREVSRNNSSTLDVDGMQVMDDLVHGSTNSLQFPLSTVDENMQVTPDSPNTAAFAHFLPEIFGPSWRCPSPFVLHFGNPAQPATPSANEDALCPIWKKSNELFGKVFSFRPGAATLDSDDVEAGLLFLGIKQGWDSFAEWMRSPALRILKEVDQFLFCHLPRLERLAAAYKSFKLLKYYLNATKSELDKIPEWLRPRPSQSRTKHPIALDFFAWPTLRDRLVSTHSTLFRSGDLSYCYSRYLKFDWPFSFDDTFFFNEAAGCYYPSPLFERYHRDLRFWTLGEEFFERFPEMRGDVEGDRGLYGEGAAVEAC